MLYDASVDGIIRVAELTKLGVSSSALTGRCRAGGTWRRILPGIILLSNGYPTARQRTIAAVTYGGRGAMVTGKSALSLYGYEVNVGDVDVVIPMHRRTQSTQFVVVERTVRLPSPVNRQGIDCVPLVRATIDAARRCTTMDATRSVIAKVVQRGDLTARELSKELEAGSVRGSALTRAVLGEIDSNVHSVPEALARELWQRSGLPDMAFNREICDARGKFIAMPDGWIDSVGLAWDIDSLEWHLSPREYRHTVERRTRMQNAGIIVLPTVPSALRDSPERVIADLRSHYRLAQSRPRPNVAISARPNA